MAQFHITCVYSSAMLNKPTYTKEHSCILIIVHYGFTIKDIKELKIDLTIPPFLDGRFQLPPEKIDAGRKIAFLCIHVEIVIRSMKT